MSPKISIIIPILNAKDYIKECLESVLNQSLKDIEILCVDANSTDGTLEILKAYAQKDKRLKLIISDKKSMGYQYNLGLKEARGEFVGFVESDDFCKPQMYERLYSVAKEKNVEVIKSDFYFVKNISGELNFTRNSISPMFHLYGEILNIDSDIKFFRDGIYINQAGIYKLSFIKQNHIKFNETPGASYQDVGFWYQIFTLASKIYYFNEAFYCYRLDNENSSSNDKKKVFCLCDEFKFIENFLEKYPQKREKIVSSLVFRKFNDYFWNLGRVGDEFKLAFLFEFQKEFLTHLKNNEIQGSFFNPERLYILNKILGEPLRYYENFILQSAISQIKNHLSYKLGSEILSIKKYPLKVFILPLSLPYIALKHKLATTLLKFLSSVNVSLKPLPLSAYLDYNEALKIKEHLSYKLGQTLIKHPLTFVFRVKGVYRKWKKAKERTSQ